MQKKLIFRLIDNSTKLRVSVTRHYDGSEEVEELLDIVDINLFLFPESHDLFMFPLLHSGVIRNLIDQKEM